LLLLGLHLQKFLFFAQFQHLVFLLAELLLFFCYKQDLGVQVLLQVLGLGFGGLQHFFGVILLAFALRRVQRLLLLDLLAHHPKLPGALVGDLLHFFDFLAGLVQSREHDLILFKGGFDLEVEQTEEVQAQETRQHQQPLVVYYRAWGEYYLPEFPPRLILA